jgi:hypothetical protein
MYQQLEVKKTHKINEEIKTTKFIPQTNFIVVIPNNK